MTKLDTNGYTAEPLNPVYSTGKQFKTVVAEITTTATAKDVIVLARGLQPTAIIRGIRFPRGTAATSGLSDVDIGFYRNNGTVALDADALADGVSFATANANTYDVLGKNISNYDHTKTIADMLGVSNTAAPTGGYEVCLTQNTSAAATLYLELIYED